MGWRARLAHRKFYARQQVYIVKLGNMVRKKNLRARALTRGALVRMKLKAIRSGVWFKNLSKDERNFMDLVVRVTSKVRSFLLAKLLFQIVEKLLEGEVSRLMRTVGKPLAQKLSEIAQGWGNRSARRWSEDPGFVQYLSIMCLNKT